LHHQAGVTARAIQTDLIGCGQAAGVHPVGLLVAATALGDGFTVPRLDAHMTQDARVIVKKLGEDETQSLLGRSPSASNGDSAASRLSAGQIGQ
jgi:hypothetical protein